MSSPVTTGDPIRDAIYARAEAATIQAIDLHDPHGAKASVIDMHVGWTVDALAAVGKAIKPEIAYHARLMKAAQQNGIVDPAAALAAALYSATDFSVVCTSLLMESYGGRNMWGGDPGGYALPSDLFEHDVTPHDFLDIYWPRASAGDTPNGCGGGQLTSYGLQLAAQKVGGCYLDGPNYKVAAIFMRQLLQETGDNVQLAYQHYNGSGPAAENYGYKALAIEERLHGIYVALR
jgi:hypothetical protein